MALLFARLQADVPLKMRRGAWYRVIQLTDLQAVIEINHRKVGVLRAWLEMARAPLPKKTTVRTLECARCRQEFEINWQEGNGVKHAG